MTETIYMSQICHFYGQCQSLKNFDMSIHSGEVLCLLGPSGCGKTTVLRIIAGLEAPSAGDVFINNKHVSGANIFIPPEKRDIGFVFQDYALFPHLTVRENIAFGIRNLSWKFKNEKIKDVLSCVGMIDFIDSYPHMLSGGQQQRVALARALAPEPKIILLDEPFSGLDVRLRNHVRDEVLHILKSSGASVIMVTHDPEEAMFMGDRILLMRNGQAIQTGKPEQLYSQPNSGFVAEFFGEINKVTGYVEDDVIHSPFGPIQNTHFLSGQKVDIFLRPESLHLSEIIDGNLPTAKVLFSKKLGSSIFLHLNLYDNVQEWHLHAKLSGKEKYKKNKKYAISCDYSQIFVFLSPQQ